MRKHFALMFLLVFVTNGPLFAEQVDNELTLAESAIALQLTACASPSGEELASTEPEGGLACTPTSTCQWRSGGCRNLSSTWCQTWKNQWCYTTCGTWVMTGQTCCYTSQPCQC